MTETKDLTKIDDKDLTPSEIGMKRVLKDMETQIDRQKAEMRRIAWPAFLDLLTDAEEDNLLDLAMTDRETKRWYDRAVGAGEIDLEDDRVKAGLQKLVVEHKITQGRLDRVMQMLPPEA